MDCYAVTSSDGSEIDDEFSLVTTYSKCPACEQSGWLISEVEDSSFDSHETDSGGPAVKRIAHPKEFRCPICSLHLYDGEVAIAGMGTDLDLGWVEL
jgi:hypothetical protein